MACARVICEASAPMIQAIPAFGRNQRCAAAAANISVASRSSNSRSGTREDRVVVLQRAGEAVS